MPLSVCNVAISGAASKDGSSMSGSWSQAPITNCASASGTFTGTRTSAPTTTPTNTPPVPTPTPTKQPEPGDTDQDGCSDQRESQTAVGSETSGGRRSHTNFWDFFDTREASSPVGDKAIAGTDFFRLLARFGANDNGGATTPNRNSNPLTTPIAAPPAYHPAFDRGPTSGPNPWNLTAANGSISGTDFFAMLAQFGHSCA
jgi:hypothetical protein